MQVEIYGIPGCKPCANSKQLCEDNNIEYRYFEVGKDVDHMQLNEKVGQPVRSVPQIFVDGGWVGGYDEFRQAVNSANS